jgi:hypothetical protein
MLYKNKYSNVTQLQLFDFINPFEGEEGEPTQAYLRSAYNYSDLENGSLISKIGNRHTRHKQTSLARRKLQIFGKQYLLYRMIYIYHCGEIPLGKLIDHVDGNPSNNKITNLRLATYSQNQFNRKNHKNQKYPKGISITFQPQRKSPWIVQLCLTVNQSDIKIIKIRRIFKTKEQAEAFAYTQLIILQAKRTQLHGEFANHG